VLNSLSKIFGSVSVPPIPPFHHLFSEILLQDEVLVLYVNFDRSSSGNCLQYFMFVLELHKKVFKHFQTNKDIPTYNCEDLSTKITTIYVDNKKWISILS